MEELNPPKTPTGDAKVFDQMLGKIVFYREGVRPLKLAYTNDIMMAIREGRVEERSEIVSQLERLWGMSGGAVRDGITAAIQEIRKRDGTQEIRDRGLAKEGEEG